MHPSSISYANISAGGRNTIHDASVAGGTRELAESKEVQPKINRNVEFWLLKQSTSLL